MSPMKCPYCWAEKAYIRKAKGWKDALLYCLLLRPMKCHHCYHKFTAPWFATFGKQVKRPPVRPHVSGRSAQRSHAAENRRAELAGVASEPSNRVLS